MANPGAKVKETREKDAIGGEIKHLTVSFVVLADGLHGQWTEIHSKNGT